MKKILVILSIFTIAVLFGSCKKSSNSPSPTPTAVTTPTTTPTPTTTVVGDTICFNLWLYVPVDGVSGTTANTTIPYYYDTSNVHIFLNNVRINPITQIYQGVNRIDRFNNIYGATNSNILVMKTGDSLVFVLNKLLNVNANANACGQLLIGRTVSSTSFATTAPYLDYKELRNNVADPLGNWIGNAYISKGNGSLANWYQGNPYRHVYKHL